MSDAVSTEVVGSSATVTSKASRVPLSLVGLLLASSLARLAIAVQGGQLYWPDERLYTQVIDIFDLHRGQPMAIARAFLGRQEHFGFAFISAGPAWVQLQLGHALSRSGNGLMVLPALLLSQISVLAVGLVYAIARRAGRPQNEALLAAGLAASSTTLFYYARHLLPYDSALCLGLLSLWWALGDRRRDAVGCGLFGALAFVTYNGYWLLVGAAMTMHALRGAHRSVGEVVRRGLLTAGGFLLVPLVVTLLQVMVGAPSLVGGMQRLAGTVTDGYAPEGFRVTWEFLWHAEHGLLALWLAATLFVALGGASWRTDGRAAAWQWLGGAVFVYVGLAMTSAVLHVFVVMGRQSRQVVPFLCLATAATIIEVYRRWTWRPWMVALATGVLVVQVGANFATPIRQRFPRDVVSEITAKYGPVDHALSLEGPPLNNPHAESRWVLLNAQHLYHPRTEAPAPPGVELMRFPHPLEFLPYQYEGFEPMERQVLRRFDISMRLIDRGVQPTAAPPTP